MESMGQYLLGKPAGQQLASCTVSLRGDAAATSREAGRGGRESKLLGVGMSIAKIPFSFKEKVLRSPPKIRIQLFLRLGCVVTRLLGAREPVIKFARRCMQEVGWGCGVGWAGGCDGPSGFGIAFWLYDDCVVQSARIFALMKSEVPFGRCGSARVHACTSLTCLRLLRSRLNHAMFKD